ncbi:MAG: RNA polymerase-binding protein DksA [Nitrospinae bacterium]|nr:RNA polymerase-binding protein DksA [Nitrospinota bacterium]
MNKKTLKYFEQELVKKRQDLIEEATKTVNTDLKAQKGELPDTVDRSSLETDRSFLLRLRDRERKLIKKIDETLARIKEGTFGICMECGEEIDEERLKVRPVATLCISCKEDQEQKEKLMR